VSSDDEEPVVIYIIDEMTELTDGEWEPSEAIRDWLQKIVREGRYG
jgi:hypothetical protein